MALIDKLNAIGDAIRAKTGKTGKLTLDQMPTEIAGITTGSGETDTPTEPIAPSNGMDLAFETTFSVDTDLQNATDTNITVQSDIENNNKRFFLAMIEPVGVDSGLKRTITTVGHSNGVSFVASRTDMYWYNGAMWIRPSSYYAFVSSINSGLIKITMRGSSSVIINAGTYSLKLYEIPRTVLYGG